MLVIIRNCLSFVIILLSINLIKSSLKFNIPSYREKCFIEEIYIEGTLLVRYDLSGFEKDFTGKDQKELFKNIKIFIKDSKEVKIFETELKARKDKFVVFIKEPGTYQICTKYFRPRGGKELSNSVLMGLKIRDDSEYKELDSSIQKEDINNFWKKINEIKKEMRPTIEAEKQELNEEDKTAKSIISSANTYYILSFIQLGIIIIITAYMVYNYKDYFKKKSII